MARNRIRYSEIPTEGPIRGKRRKAIDPAAMVAKNDVRLILLWDDFLSCDVGRSNDEYHKEENKCQGP